MLMHTIPRPTANPPTHQNIVLETEDYSLSNSNRREKFLSSLGQAHLLTFRSQNTTAEVLHLELACEAFDSLFTLPKPKPTSYLMYASALTGLNKKTQAAQVLLQMVDFYADHDLRVRAEIELGVLLHRLFQFNDASMHFSLAAKFLQSKARQNEVRATENTRRRNTKIDIVLCIIPLRLSF